MVVDSNGAPACGSLPVMRIAEIALQDNSPRWLVEGLWGASSVGVIGGAPSARRPGWGWTSP